MSPPKNAWEPLDSSPVMFGVFHTEDYSASPFALFVTDADALAWIAQQRALPEDDRRFGNCDVTVLAVRDVKGEAWNDHSEPDRSAPKVVG